MPSLPEKRREALLSNVFRLKRIGKWWKKVCRSQLLHWKARSAFGNAARAHIVFAKWNWLFSLLYFTASYWGGQGMRWWVPTGSARSWRIVGGRTVKKKLYSPQCTLSCGAMAFCRKWFIVGVSRLEIINRIYVSER